MSSTLPLLHVFGLNKYIAELAANSVLFIFNRLQLSYLEIDEVVYTKLQRKEQLLDWLLGPPYQSELKMILFWDVEPCSLLHADYVSEELTAFIITMISSSHH
jgi:hypothetical protein